MLREVCLHGDLAKFGRRRILDVDSASEAVRALCTQVKGFRVRLLHGEFHVVWKMPNSKIFMNQEGLNLSMGAGSLHIVPAMAGAKSSTGTGTFMLIAGVALVATAFLLAPAAAAGSGALFGANWGATAISLGSVGAITFGNIASLGLGLILLGAGQLLAPKQPVLDAGNALADGSDLFTAPGNITAQGLGVPLAYGKILVGSLVISQGVSNAAAGALLPSSFVPGCGIIFAAGGYSEDTNLAVLISTIDGDHWMHQLPSTVDDTTLNEMTANAAGYVAVMNRGSPTFGGIEAAPVGDAWATGPTESVAVPTGTIQSSDLVTTASDGVVAITVGTTFSTSGAQVWMAFRSTDDIHWEDLNIKVYQPSSNHQIQYLAYGNGRWVLTYSLASSNTLYTIVSLDSGSTWGSPNVVATGMDPLNFITAIASNGVAFCIVTRGSPGDSLVPRIFYSTDGAVWTESTPAITDPTYFLDGLGSHGLKFIAVGTDFNVPAQGIIMTSDDNGPTWVLRLCPRMPGGALLWDVVSNGTICVIVGFDWGNLPSTSFSLPVALKSLNGEDWERKVPGAYVTIGPELISNSTFVANDTGWTFDGTITTWAPGQFVTTDPSLGDPTLNIDVATISGRIYALEIHYTASGDQLTVYGNNNSWFGATPQYNPGNMIIHLFSDYTGVDTLTIDFMNETPGATRTITFVSLREVTLAEIDTIPSVIYSGAAKP